MQELQGKVAVVTGGASGIGLALSRAFLNEGMKVVIADIEQEALDAAVGELTPSGSITGVRTDVSKLESVEDLADTVYRTHGACHILCNNAGVGAPSSKVWATTPNDWRWVFGVNVTGVVNGILTFVPRMLEGGHQGHIVNTSSPDGPISPLSTASVYAASKAAVSTITECLAAQLVADETNLRAHILVDCSKSMAFKSGELSKLGYASYLAAALSYLMLHQNDAVGLVLFDSEVRQYLPPKARKTQFRRILDLLDHSYSNEDTDVGAVLHDVAERIPRRGLVIILSDLIDDEANYF